MVRLINVGWNAHLLVEFNVLSLLSMSAMTYDSVPQLIIQEAIKEEQKSHWSGQNNGAISYTCQQNSQAVKVAGPG